MPPARRLLGFDLHLYVGMRLRIRRKAQGVSLEALAEAVDVSRQQLQKYEAGINRITAVTLFLLACRLGVPITYFFEGAPIETLALTEAVEEAWVRD